MSRTVIKKREPGFFLGYYECARQPLSQENRGKIALKEIPSCFIPCLHVLVVFTWQLKTKSIRKLSNFNFQRKKPCTRIISRISLSFLDFSRAIDMMS